MTLTMPLAVGLLSLGQVGPLTHLESLTEHVDSPARLAVTDTEILVTDPRADNIVRYDLAGTYLGTWSEPAGPLGVAVHPDGRIFVSRREDGKVGVYENTFTFLRFLGDGNPMVQFVKPTDLAVDPTTGRIYVVDSGGDRVYGFADDESLALMLGVRGGASSQFKYPSAIAVDSANSRLLVADQDNYRVQVFSTSGLFLFKFGYRIKYPPGGGSEGWFPRTAGLAVDAQSQIYITDGLMSTLRVFSPTGLELGKVLEYGFDPGDLRTPCAVVFDGAGRILVANSNAGAVELYSAPPKVRLEKTVGRRFAGDNLSDYDLTLGSVGRSAVALDPDGGEDRRRPEGSLRTTYDPPHMLPDVICGRCHSVDAQPGGHLGLVEGQTNLCISCHTTGGHALPTAFRSADAADPYGTNPAVPDGRGTSHAWGVPAVNALADSVGPRPGGGMQPYLTDGNLKCATCHNQHNNDAGVPFLRVSNTGDAMCKECHAPRDRGPGEGGSHAVGFAYPSDVGEFPDASSNGLPPLKDGKVECLTCHAVHDADSGGAYDGAGDGMLLRGPNDGTLCRSCHTEHIGHTPGGSWQPTCNDCHDVHDPANLNLALVGATVYNRTLGVDKPVVFTAETGPNSFADGEPPAIDGICEVCHTATTYHRHDGTGAPHNASQDCTTCHPHDAGFMPMGGACDSCHGAPPTTGAHLKHFEGDVSMASYGGTANLSTTEAYIFVCGSCHPLSSTFHRNGTVDVELYNAAAPAGSLKSLSPSTASYTPGGTTYTDDHGIPYSLGACSNIYCHSKTDWSSPDPISAPLLDPVNGWALLDANGNLTYEPYTVTESKVYATVSWGGAPVGCNGCHRNNPQTSYPAVQAGVGNSHGWVDDWGYEDLHAWNMSFDPLTCRVCHYQTVTAEMTWTRDSWDITYFDDAPIADKSYHVNGVRNVAFDPVNPVAYDDDTYSLAGVTYDPQTKVCSGVPCHLEQCSPEWGKPYRWWTWSLECDQCHRYGGPWPPDSPCDGKTATRSMKHGADARGKCLDCHEGHRPARSLDSVRGRRPAFSGTH
ncbi:MAG: cytochrome c3 family protein [Planctomycetota bacterium]